MSLSNRASYSSAPESATSSRLAPTRSSAELKQLVGEDFEGILSSDCFSAYNPQSAAAKQKCLTHLERDLEALKLSRFNGNRLLAEAVSEILATARTRYREYHAGQLSRKAMAAQRLVLESQLQDVLINAPVKLKFPLKGGTSVG